MADATIAVDEPAVADLLLDAESLTVGVDTVLRERMQIAGTAAADIAPVSATEGLKVNLGPTDNAVLDAIAASLATLDNVVSGNEAQVDVLSSVLPSGAATEGKQDTQITALQLIDDVVYVDDADWTDNTSKHALVGGVYQATPHTVTDGDVTPFLTDENGRIEAVVSGTVNLGATDNAVLDNIDADLTTIIGHVDGIEGLLGGTIAVSNAGLTELAAAINTNKVDINIVSSDISFGGTSAADDADFSAGTTPGTPAMGVYESTPTSVTDGDVGVVGITQDRRVKTSATVDAALPAGTNNIGDVDVLSVVPGTGATNLGKAEDAAHSTGDVGVMALGVRQSSQADFGADGDYVPFSVDDDGGLRVSIVAGAGSGGTASADDADFVAGTTSGTPAMGVYESTPSSVTDGDLGTVGITQTRQLRVAAGQEGTWAVDLGATDNAVLDAIAASLATLDDIVAGSEAQVDVVSSALPTGAATSAKQDTIIGHVDGIEALLGTIDADTGGILTAVQTLDNAISGSEMQVDVVAALPAGDNNIGNVDVVTVPADPFGVNADAASATGSISAKLRFIASTGIPITALPAVSSATLANVGDSASSVTLQASNAARKGWTCYNDSGASLYIKFGATASATSFNVLVPPYGYYEMPSGVIYTGVIDGIWSSDAGGNARVMEL